MNEAVEKDNQIERQLENRSRRFWTAMILGFLGLQLVTNVVAIVAATSQPEDTIVPDYYQKGLKWDQRFESPDTSETPPTISREGRS